MGVHRLYDIRSLYGWDPGWLSHHACWSQICRVVPNIYLVARVTAAPYPIPPPPPPSKHSSQVCLCAGTGFVMGAGDSSFVTVEISPGRRRIINCNTHKLDVIMSMKIAPNDFRWLVMSL